MTTVTIRPVTSEDWAFVERLFGSRGACGGCWCMHWHAPSGAKAWEAMKGEPNRRALRSMIEDGECHAVIALDGAEPVGWCKAGPIGSLQRLRRSRKLWRDDMADWAIVCFFIKPTHRGLGLAPKLLSAAADLSFDRGARSVEGYPSVPAKARMPAVFAWCGVPAVFEAAGFHSLPIDAGARRIYRLDRR